jgi:two-component system, sensor histidine kinase and response regulator
MNGLSLSAAYDLRLVVLSVAMAIFASHVAIDFAGRVTASSGRARMAWLVVGAFAMGMGIWSMHYIGMLAYTLPIPVCYHIPTVGLSLLAGILASFVALFVVSRERITAQHISIGSLLVGSGIAGMHYIGMAAMRLQAMHRYQPVLLLLSVFLAVVVSFVGMLLIARLRLGDHNWRIKIATAVILGLAIPIMHYTGMAAVKFTPTKAAPDLSRSMSISRPL